MKDERYAFLGLGIGCFVAALAMGVLTLGGIVFLLVAGVCFLAVLVKPAPLKTYVVPARRRPTIHIIRFWRW